MVINNFEIIESMLNSNTEEANAGIIAFSKFLSTLPLKESNVHIFQKILSRNLTEAADSVFKRRSPETFFSILHSTGSLINFAFNTLSKYKAKELYTPILLCLLGVIQNAYKHPSEGIKIYPLNVSEVYHMSKYLKKNEDAVEDFIVDILEKLGSLPSNIEASIISRKILDTWLDKSKKLESIIPSVILL